MTKIKKNNNIVLESWVNEFADHIANESLKLVEAIGKPKGASKELSSKFLSYYIEKMIISSFKRVEDKENNPLEAFEAAKNSYLELKQEVQEEIARGFEKAFKTYLNQNVEYYCQIKLVPEPASKELN